MIRAAPLAVALALGLLAAEPANAQRQPDPVRVQLIAHDRAAVPGEPITVSIRLRVADGWHIYGADPADVGLPTAIRWHLPPGVEAGPLSWPAPGRGEAAGLRYDAYRGTIVVRGTLLPGEAVAGTKQMKVRAVVVWGACREVCVPGRASLALTLPVRASETSEGTDPPKRQPERP